MGLYSTQQKLKLLHAEERVTQILTDYPESRNCDKRLNLIFLREFHNVETLEEYLSNSNCTSTATIERVRRKIQARGELLPTDPKVLKARFKLEEVFEDYALDTVHV